MAGRSGNVREYRDRSWTPGGENLRKKSIGPCRKTLRGTPTR